MGGVSMDKKPLSVGEWMLTIFVLAIPLVNIIMYFVWALSSSGNLNRKNFCIASLLWALIIIVLVGFFVTIGAMVGIVANAA